MREERGRSRPGFDGDGDRFGVVDDHSDIIWGNILMIFHWREILAPVSIRGALWRFECSQVLYDVIARLGGRAMFYRTEHSLIMARMKEVSAVLTGETQGHIFFADEYYGYNEAVFAVARLLRVVLSTDRPMSGLLPDVPRHYITPRSASTAD